VLVQTLVREGGTVEIVIGEALERRWGPKIHKRGHWRDSQLSSQEREVALKWIAVGNHGSRRESTMDKGTMGSPGLRVF
jgi:hypothetical protein